jgi:hypothetical protein
MIINGSERKYLSDILSTRKVLSRKEEKESFQRINECENECLIAMFSNNYMKTILNKLLNMKKTRKIDISTMKQIEDLLSHENPSEIIVSNIRENDKLRMMVVNLCFKIIKKKEFKTKKNIEWKNKVEKLFNTLNE